MGVRILAGTRINDTGDAAACFYCSVTCNTFGPLYEDQWEAEDFLQYCLAEHKDPRKLWDDGTLTDIYLAWRERKAA